MAHPVRLKSHSVTISAPRELVFQMTSSFGRGRTKGDNGESSRVLKRSDDGIVAEFKSRTGRFTITTVERVVLDPPDRMTFEHISGPLRHAQEVFVFREVPEGTELEHSGEFVWFEVPLLGWVAGALLVRRPFERVLKRHMEAIRVAAEARAAKSHVFRMAEAS